MSALAFDPHKALAEIETEAGLRANRAKRANPAQILAPLAPLALSPQPIATLSPAPVDPAAWFASLELLAPSKPPTGIDAEWWQVLIADARWLARHHAESAASLGWSASDLFGVRPQFGPGEGGVADRLDGARRIAFTGNVAHWQSPDAEGWLWRRTLDPKPLLWEV